MAKKVTILQPTSNRVSVNEQQRNVVRSIGLAGGGSGGGGDVAPAYGRANAALVLATHASANAANAFAKANTANAFAFQASANAASAFTQANNATADAAAAGLSAGAAFNKANSANLYVYQVDGNAQAAFGKANTANVLAFQADVNATEAFIKANTANALGFQASANAAEAFAKANTANALAFQSSANAAAAFADSNTRVSKSGDTMNGPLIMESYIDVVSAVTPATPPVGRARFYAQQAFGYDAIGYINALGVPIVLARDHIVLCRNSTGATLTRGTAVYVSGAQGGTPKIDKALASATALAVPAIGLVILDIPNNATGAVMVSGVMDMNTSAFAVGEQVFVSATTPGALTSTVPSHPNVRQLIGVVEVSGVGNGQVLVNVISINPHEYEGVNGVSWAIGDGAGTTKSLKIVNAAGIGALQWNPTTNRTLTLPDTTDTLATQTGVNAAFDKANTAIGLPTQVVTTSSATLALNYALGNYIILNLGHNVTTFSVTGWPTVPGRLTMEIRNTGAFNITFPSGYLAVGGAPVITSGAGKRDMIVLTSAQAGVNVFVHMVGQNFTVI